ncbi:hypothetical protein ACOBWO_003500, partial [Vibrio cholerae]
KKNGRSYGFFTLVEGTYEKDHCDQCFLALISFSRCEKTAVQGGLFRNTYDFAVGKSFHDSSYRKSTSSIPALCLDQDVLDRATRISHRPREVR